MSSLLYGRELRSGLVPFKPGTAGYRRLVTHRISQVPGEPIPYLCPALGSRPVPRPSPSRPDDAVPTLRTVRTPALRSSRDSITRLQYPAAYASSDALPHPHARLASGRWLTFAGWELNPLDSIEKFRSSTSDFLLSQIYPGATAKVPQSPGAPFRPLGALFQNRTGGRDFKTASGAAA